RPDDIEPVGIDPRDERAEVDDIGFELGDAIGLENRLDDVDDGARGLAVGIDKAVGLLVRDAHRQLLRALRGLEGALCPCAGGQDHPTRQPTTEGESPVQERAPWIPFHISISLHVQVLAYSLMTSPMPHTISPLSTMACVTTMTTRPVSGARSSVMR